MLAPNSDPAHEAIAAAADLAETRLGPADGPAAADFVRRFYAHAPAGDIAGVEPEALARQAISIFKFAAGRAPDAPAVRAFNPTLADDGWRTAHTVVEVIQNDMPFLVDSVAAELNRHGFGVHLVIHPVLHLDRADGRIVAVNERSADGGNESIMQFHVDARSDAAELAAVEEDVRRVLSAVSLAVKDWGEMRRRTAAAIEGLTLEAPGNVAPDRIAEAADFLAWLEDDHFTFLGYREYAYEGAGDDFKLISKPETGLGLLASDAAWSPTGGPKAIDSLPGAALAKLAEPRVLNVMKSSVRSPVHRPAQMDYVQVQTFDADGNVTGERRFIGLFTSTVYTTSPRRIPILRRKVADVVAHAGAGRGGHDEKALVHILETYPRDELLQVETEDLAKIASGILNLQERQRTALFTRRDMFDRFVSALVYVPRDRYDTALRRRMGAILAEDLDGEIISFGTHIGDDPLARVHYVVQTGPGKAAAADMPAIEAKLADASRSWSDKLETALVSERGAEDGLALFRRYQDAFPQSYREAINAEMAARDIALIEAVAAKGGIGVDLVRPMEAGARQLHFKLFHAGAPAPLSDVLPMLEDMGLRILTETPARVAALGQDVVYLHQFEAETADKRDVDLRAIRPKFLEAFERVWAGDADSDGFNRLVLSAGLGWREIALLRAFSRYLRQAAAPFSVDYMEDAITGHPEIAAKIAAYFAARLEPGKADIGAADAAKAEALAALDAVASLDEDRILRRFINIVDATLRTNFWQPDGNGSPKPYISLKLDSAAIEDLPLPRPMAEIFVFSPRMEGVHLRGGKVARGGIRWSDRREDFRTEILGLMKAQMVKNTVIVPVGAKGGFIVKRPPTEGGRDAFLAEGVECYKTLIRGMLDVTDNFVDGQVVPPEAVVRIDGDDPYIVAAADKGTATFSDIANGISADYGFWLGDAFASGGSAGYDHKKMGITARGAWESVKRMFLELGKDIQEEPFTVVGCGDMSGDVFGNGMLLSKQIKLVAAFNHMHIFVDPDPDPATSWAERKRMFDLPRSSWTDYDQSTLSKGGAIYERSAKSLSLSPEVRRALDMDQAQCTPNELINAILKAPAELLWFGGIGNYVKARSEGHQDAGDRANDPVRVNGSDVRAKVIGEGANLGVTQLGRVEFAEAGGRINADFIDNSAGVDASDHEVNLKILLGRVVADGDMTGKQRDTLLAEMTDEVGRLILRNNYMQGQALSMAERIAPSQIGEHGRFMRALERTGRLNRAVEFLPDDEALSEREAAGKGLTRPELAVLLSYAKLDLFDALAASDLSHDPGLRARLRAYFPEAIQARFQDRADNHQLGGEIAATLLTNEIVDRMGPSYLDAMVENSGRSPADVARAFVVATDAFSLAPIYGAIESLDRPGGFALQAEMFGEAQRLTRRAIAWLLRRSADDMDIRQMTEDLAEPIAMLKEGLSDVASPMIARQIADRVAEWTRQGAPEDVAHAVAQLDPLAAALDIAHVARADDDDASDMLEAAAIYYAAGDELGLARMRRAARGLPSASGWDKLAVEAAIDDLYGHQAEIARKALALGGLPAWTGPRSGQIAQLGEMLDDMEKADTVTLAMVTVANNRFRALSAS